MKKQIQIFIPGKHTAMSGAALSFSEADLKACAAAYDPAKHEAPIVIGHPKHADPAFGWVKSLSFADGLEAEHQQVNPEFAEMVDRGAFKKVSASFYTPDSPSNPVPGVYYLRHVGFLGAQPPAVKGLRNPEFAEAEVGVIEFGDWDDRTTAGLLRSMRDWIIAKFGIDDADKALPSWDVQSLADSAAQPEPDESVGSPGFHEVNQPKGEVMSVEDKARLAALELENAVLKKNSAEFAEAAAKTKRAATHVGHVAFAEGLIKEGKLLPAYKNVIEATLDFMAGQEAVVEFGEGDVRKPLLDAFKGLLQASPKQVEFAEKAGGKGETGGVEKDPAAIAAAAVEFQESEAAAGRVVNSAQAVQHVLSKAGA